MHWKIAESCFDLLNLGMHVHVYHRVSLRNRHGLNSLYTESHSVFTATNNEKVAERLPRRLHVHEIQSISC